MFCKACYFLRKAVKLLSNAITIKIQINSIGGCLDYYHFEDFTTEELRAYAKFKKLKVSNSGGRQELIELLYKFVIVSKSMDVWNVYRQKFKQDHPNIPHKELLKQASIQYNLEKQELLNKL